jgi:hypothetical protein
MYLRVSYGSQKNSHYLLKRNLPVDLCNGSRYFFLEVRTESVYTVSKWWYLGCWLVELGWVRLDWFGFGLGLGLGLGWFGLVWVGWLIWAGFGWIGVRVGLVDLGWVRLDWFGLGWGWG